MLLFQRHHLHSLAIHGDCAVRYPGGHWGHGHLHWPVALGEAGYHSLVHAHRDLDQAWRDKARPLVGPKLRTQALAQTTGCGPSGHHCLPAPGQRLTCFPGTDKAQHLFFFPFSLLSTRSCVAQVGLELLLPLPQPPQCSDAGFVPCACVWCLCLAVSLCLTSF